MKIERKSIGALIKASVNWAKNPKHGVLYAHSGDGGFISLRVDDYKHQGLYFRRVNIMRVEIPVKDRRNGLYSELIRSLDRLNRFGIRWHDSVENQYLAERHKKRGYFIDKSSFYNVTGKAYPEDIQLKMNKDSELARQELAVGLAKPFSVGMRRKKKNA